MASRKLDRGRRLNGPGVQGSRPPEAIPQAPGGSGQAKSTTVPGLYLLAERGSPPAPMHVTPASLGDVDVTFTDETTGRPHIREALLAAIAGAQRKVLFASFLFSDEAIVQALCAASERLRGGVYVITALGKHMQADLSEPDAEEDLGVERRRQREQKHEGLLREMARAGVWLRSSEDAHAKLCVVDDELCAVTSANATKEAYESNPELALLVRRPRVARDLGRLFARVWLHRSTIDSQPGADLNVRSRTAVKASDWAPLSTSGDVRAVATLASDERSLLAATLDIIDRAEQELCIATYSLVAIEQHPVGVALRHAARRGVQIRLVLQPKNQREDQRKTCAWLVECAPRKVLVRGLARTHAKAIVADGKRAIAWTGNLDGRHGYESGFEVGIASEVPAVVERLRAYVKDLFDRAPFRPVLDPTADFLRSRGIDPPEPGSPSASGNARPRRKDHDRR